MSCSTLFWHSHYPARNRSHGPGSLRRSVSWATEQKGYSQRRACGLVGLEPKTYRYASKRPDDGEIRARLRVLAGERRRFGYRRLHILLAREGVLLNHKKLFRDECLNEHLFSSLAAARRITEA